MGSLGEARLRLRRRSRSLGARVATSASMVRRRGRSKPRGLGAGEGDSAVIMATGDLPTGPDSNRGKYSHMRSLVWVLGMFSFLVRPPVLAAQSGTLPGGAAGSAADAVTLTPGDVVRITVWRKPELSGEFGVSADGTVAHPLYREVQVAGVPLLVAEQRLRGLLEKYEANPQFVIEALLRVAVAGEVRQPNLFTLRPETSVSQAVALAGGPTERGRRDRLLLVRQNGRIVIDLRRADASGAGMPIRSGDQILIERSSAFFRDYVTPAVSILGATAAIISVIIYNRNR